MCWLVLRVESGALPWSASVWLLSLTVQLARHGGANVLLAPLPLPGLAAVVLGTGARVAAAASRLLAPSAHPGGAARHRGHRRGRGRRRRHPLVRRLRPDVVVMDVRMPLLDGIEATRAVLAAFPDPPKILAITTFENDAYVYEALRAGADGFLLKRADPAEIAHAIRLVSAGSSLLFPAALRRMAAAHTNPRAREALERAALTNRETGVLRLMARGMSNTQIAAELVPGTETVKTHVSAILTELGARDRTQAVIAAYEPGFVTPG